jgi:hypothetical protein
MTPSRTRIENLPPLARRSGHQRQQREDSAFAAVVCAQNEHDVFERHHHQQRPEDQRDDAEDVGSRRRPLANGAERDGKGVERARADIAEHDTEGGQREKQGIVGAARKIALIGVGRRRRRGGDSKCRRGAAAEGNHRRRPQTEGEVRLALSQVVVTTSAYDGGACAYPRCRYFRDPEGRLPALPSPWFARTLCR